MRILSVGIPLPGPAVDNHSFAGAPAFFDYDAVVIDPVVVSTAVEGGTAGLAEMLRDRRDETARLLERGGLVVCYTQPNVRHDALPEHDRYCWLPVPPGLSYGHPPLREGSGTQIDVSDGEHPFAAFIERFRAKMAYQAYFDEEAPGFAGRVFARSHGGAAVGVELDAGAGRIVFVPPLARPLTGDERYAYSNALQDAVRQTLRVAAETDAPRWTGEYTLPGLSERLASRDEARAHVIEAQEALARAEDAASELQRFQRLLWQEGKYGLEQVVREALALIGLNITPNNFDRPAAVSLAEPAGAALLEVDASVQAVGLEGHERLRHRLEAAATRGGPTRGLLVINGYRTLAPEKRPSQYHDDLRAAAERLGCCVATTEQLFHAVRAALEGDEATVRSFRERLLTATGILGDD